MEPGRRVQLRWASATVTIDGEDGRPETLSYAGIAFVRQHGDHVAGKAWLPVGNSEPSFTDDEALIVALRTAWLWSIAV